MMVGENYYGKRVGETKTSQSGISLVIVYWLRSPVNIMRYRIFLSIFTKYFFMSTSVIKSSFLPI